MAFIVKSSIDILPWTELEKQKLIEEKKEFLKQEESSNKKVEKVEKVEKIEENKKEDKEDKKVKNSINKEKISLKKQGKKEVKE